MARLAGVELSDNWRLDYALTRIKGIGWKRAGVLLVEMKLDGKKRMRELSSEDLALITNKIEEYPVEGELVRKIRADIQRLRDIGSYRGNRHTRGLPVRGQRTRTNARTKRGKRKTVGAFKKEVLAKQTQTAAKEGK